MTRVIYSSQDQYKAEKEEELKKLKENYELAAGINRITTLMMIHEYEHYFKTGEWKHNQIPFWTIEDGKVYEDLNTLNPKYRMREVVTSGN